MVNLMAEKAREARRTSAASGSCRQMLLMRGDGWTLYVPPRRKGKEERKSPTVCLNVSMQLKNRELREEAVNDNQTGEQEKGYSTVVVVVFVVTCHVPLSKSYTVSQQDFYIFFVFFCNIAGVFLPRETEKKCAI